MSKDTQENLNQPQELTPRMIADAITIPDKLKAVWEDPEVKEALAAVYRTLLNLGISAADTVPVLGAIPSWGADLGKFIDPYVRKYLGIGTDLSPDVSKGIAVGTEAIEIFGAGFFPSHAIETTLQLIKDWDRLKKGLQKAREILAAETRESLSQDVINASSAFGVDLNDG